MRIFSLNLKKKDIFFWLGIFLFFLIILFLCPLAGDDWGNYFVGKDGIDKIFINTYNLYFTWEGRIVSRFLIYFFTYHKILWNIVNAFLITTVLYLIIKLIKPINKKEIYLLSVLVLLGMNMYTFSQVIVWVAGNITYFFVIPLLLFYFYSAWNDKIHSNKFLFLIINMVAAMFIEHMAIILVFANFFFLLKLFISNRKIDKDLLCYTICSLLCTLLMVFSPGNSLRSGVENVDFKTLSLFGKFVYNIPNFIYYTYIINCYSLILLITSNSLLIRKISNKIVKYIYFIINILPFFTFISYIFSFIGINYLSFFSNIDNLFIVIYYIFYTFFTLYLLLKDGFNKALFFYVIGILSNLVMMMSPTWGYRTSFATYLFLCISSLLIISKYTLRSFKLGRKFLYLVVIFFISFYGILYFSVNRQYNDNLKVIKFARENKSNVIKIKEYPYFASCNINPSSEYHIYVYKKYFNIDDDVKLEFIPNNWKYWIIYHK